MSATRAHSVTALALAALALVAGCDAALAQGVPDGGRGGASFSATDGAARRASAVDGGVRSRAARDGGGAGAATPEDAGRSRARRDAGPRRTRHDAGSEGISIAIAIDAGATERAPSPAPEGIAAIAADAGAGPTAAGGASSAAGVLDGGPDVVRVEGGVAIGADAIDDAGALAGDAAIAGDAAAASEADAAIAAAPDDTDAGAALALGPGADAGATLLEPPPVARTEGAPGFDPWALLARLASDEGERDDGARDRDGGDDERARGGGGAPVPIVVPVAGRGDGSWEQLRALVPALPSGRWSVFFLLLLLAATVAGARWARRARARLPERGAIPFALALAHAALRIAIALVVIVALADLLPDWARSALPWVVVAAAVALGWSARDVLPDLVAGAVLLTERRLARGEHVRIGDHAGVVTEIGLRVTTLRDASGRELRVPNRVVIASPTTSQRARWHEVSVQVRAPADVAPEAFARALRDAALLSAWIPVPARAEVARDPGDPRAFEVRATLLDARFEPRFRGELLTRAEHVLRSGATASSPP